MSSLHDPPPTYEQALQLPTTPWTEIQLQPPLQTAQQPSQLMWLQQQLPVIEQPQEEGNITFSKCKWMGFLVLCILSVVICLLMVLLFFFRP